MALSPALLPVTRPESSSWTIAVLMVIVVAILFLAAVFFVIDPTGGMVILVVYAIGPAVGCGHMLLKHWRRRRRRDEWALRARALGLDYHDHVEASVLEPFLDLPLFCFGSGAHLADSLGIGFEGREVLLLNYGHIGTFLTKGGVAANRKFVQTIALFPGLTALPDFHLAPGETDWDFLMPGWPWRLDVGRVVKRIHGDETSIIRAHDVQAASALFDEKRLEELGNLAGWTVECDNGKMVIYRYDEMVTPEEMPYFLHRAVDIVRVLTEQRASVPLAGGAIQTAPSQRPRGSQEGICPETNH